MTSYETHDTTDERQFSYMMKEHDCIISHEPLYCLLSNDFWLENLEPLNITVHGKGLVVGAEVPTGF